ncbi:proline-rich protein 36-like [Neocloeon triangulifer]|uniref:proline-rich protein 36-like n=1 Tax=Neocloeon triangulifer TaxID=2078957 RepID=UPI00286F9404|nr:proline-rich protein 36-like [Neocloeon triangulifer]
MSAQGSGAAPKRPKNPLLFGAELGFPFDNLQGSAILMPIAHEDSSDAVQDASKPAANILLQEPAALPPAPLPSAAVPLFSLFKQALGAVTETPAKPPEPEPAKEAASEVPLYAPAAAPVPVPLFDPTTLEVNGNEPGQDLLNGNGPTFFDPGRFQSNIASLQTFNPAEFTQQPPPDLPAPTPSKSEVQSQGQGTCPVFTTAPSQEAPDTTTLSTASPGPFSAPEAQGAPEEAPEVDNYNQGYYFQGEYNQNYYYGEQYYPDSNFNQQYQYYNHNYQPPQFYDPGQYAQGHFVQEAKQEPEPQVASSDQPEAEETFPTPPPAEPQDSSFEGRELENLSLDQEERPEQVPLNVYNIPQNTSIYNSPSPPAEHRPPSSIPPPEPAPPNLPAEPPVSSTPLSAYFSQKVDSRPSSVASSFFDSESQSAADFFNSPKTYTPPQPLNPSNFFSPPVSSYFAPPARTEPPPTAQFFQPQSPPQTSLDESQPQVTKFFNPEGTPAARTEPLVEQIPPPPSTTHFSTPQTAPEGNQQNLANFFNPEVKTESVQQNHPPEPAKPPTTVQFFSPQPTLDANQQHETKFFNPMPEKIPPAPSTTQFFTPQTAPEPQPPLANFFNPEVRTEQQGQQNQPPPGAQIFTPLVDASQAQPITFFSPEGPTEVKTDPQVELIPPPPSTTQFFTPAAQLPPQEGNQPLFTNLISPEVKKEERHVRQICPPKPANPPPAVQFFTPQQDASQPKFFNPEGTPATSNLFQPEQQVLPPPSQIQGASPSPPPENPPLPTSDPGVQLFNPNLFGQAQKSTPQAEGNKFRIKTALNKYAPPPSLANSIPNYFAPPATFGLPPQQEHPSQEPSTPPNTPAVVLTNPLPPLQADPPCIPASISQIHPKVPPVINPYSNSAAPKQCVAAPDAPLSHQPPPPPKTTMSGNYHRLNSRPQYAAPPGLSSSVSAMASLAASMAMSSPIPTAGAEPHGGFAPIPCIAIGSTSADPVTATHNMPLDGNAPPYAPVTFHWFFKQIIETKEMWCPFSKKDSSSLEAAFLAGEQDRVVATDGGRYDVNVFLRKRVPIYWDQPPNEVRRCSWFYKNPLDSSSYPYEESFASKLEEEYRSAYLYNRWPRRIELSFGEAIVFSGPNVMSHIPPTTGSILEDWGTIQDTGAKSRIVRRGWDEFEIDEGEPAIIDHLVFLVHGIGSVCDLRFRNVVEVVDDFRSIALTLTRSHFRQAGDDGRVNRIEVLPVYWHGSLHGEETGIDRQLKNLTLKSIPKLREFTNDTLLDILFYTSPVYCQTIVQTVGHELNRLQQLFMQRNPGYSGGISLGGHSLGSLILFDLLCHQIPKKEKSPVQFGSEDLDKDERGLPLPPPTLVRRDSCKVDYMMGHGGTGQPSIHYPQIHFSPMAFFALGSPTGMFVTVRGIESLGKDFVLPTCPAYYNIFHPYDPVAYRMEGLISAELGKSRPVLIPHHKGRKRMHIELRETLDRVSTDLKGKLVDSVKSTWNTVYQMAMFTRAENLAQEVDKVIAEQMMVTDAMVDDQSQFPDGLDPSEPDPALLGKLNGGRRVDYVLQEAPLESFNQYIFALSSHVCYWESEDTMLLILREIYNTLGVNPDRQFDRTREGSMVRERSWSGGSKESKGSPSNPSFLSPSSFPSSAAPPTSGFVRK